MENRMVQTALIIEGMHCNSCELRVEQELTRIPGVVKARADYVKSRLELTYDPMKVDFNQITDCIQRLDYRIKGGTEGNSNNPDSGRVGAVSFSQLIGIAIMMLAAYLVINNTVGFRFVPQISQNMGYGLLFVVGLITSIHCLAMCGGINISQCAGTQFEVTKADKTQQLMPSLKYNLGRVISYTVLGGLVGALGSVVSFSGTAKGMVAIIAGVFMAIMGLNMLNIFPWLRRFSPRLPKGLSNLVNRNNKQHGPLYVGLFNGLMPCGPLQAMQLYALGTGSAVAGALSMMVFSLGTVPLMFGLGAVSAFLNSKFKQRMLQVSGVLVVVLGMIMLSRGLNLSGINLAYASSSSRVDGNLARIEGKVQVVSTTVESGRYTPIVVQKGIPVKWTINVTEENLNGCNNPVTIPEYSIQKELVPGENVIEEFTPREEGTITYTCWMGMISSTITVVDDLANVSEKDLRKAVAGGTTGGAGGAGCCQRSAPTAPSNKQYPTGCCGSIRK